MIAVLLVVCAARLGVGAVSDPSVVSRQDHEALSAVALSNAGDSADAVAAGAGAADAFADWCAASGVPEPVALLNETAQRGWQCVRRHVDSDQFAADMARHISNGTLDLLFAERCTQMPDAVRTCAADALASLEPCWTGRNGSGESGGDDATVGRNSTQLAIDTLMAGVDFLCYGNGERMAIFLGYQGQECISSNSTRQLGRQCLADRFGSAEPDSPSLISDTVLAIVAGVGGSGADSMANSSRCARLRSVRHCVTVAMETCESSTPLNVVDSLFGVMLRSLCGDMRATSAGGQLPVACAHCTVALLLLLAYLR